MINLPTQSWKASLRAVGMFVPLTTVRFSINFICDTSSVVKADVERINDEKIRKRCCNAIFVG